LLRKLLAGRTSIAMACRIGGCEINDFFGKPRALGFVVQEPEEPNEEMNLPPDFLDRINLDNIMELDVRPI
jgi:hypothetical protein